jgi:hypothetical protein
MCIPRSANDPLCPITNRPKDSTGKPTLALQFKDPTTVVKGVDPDPSFMVPLVVGDYVTFSGQQVGQLYEVSNLEANVGIFTAPGTQPSYLTVEAVQIGINSPNTGNFAVAETKATAFTTDPTATIQWLAQDVDPCTGQITERLITTLQAENAGPPLGRAVFRLGKIVMTPATRNVIFRMTSATSTANTVTNTVGNFTAGQFVQPVLAFVFPELTVPGQNFASNAFEAMPFLALGSGPYVPGNPLATPLANPPIIGQLNPWPRGDVPPPTPTSCPPIVSPSPSPTVSSSAITSPSPSAGPSPDTITIIGTPTSTKARQGTFQVDVTATTNNLGASLFLTISGSNPVPNPLTNAPMTNLGGGKFSISASIKGVPISGFVTSDKGGKSKTFTF